MAAEKIRVVELEEKIGADSDGALRNEVSQHLRETQAEMKREIDAGLAPEDFDRAQKIYAGLERADAVLNDIWTAQHR